jgi:hypothetical protein
MATLYRRIKFLITQKQINRTLTRAHKLELGSIIAKNWHLNNIRKPILRTPQQEDGETIIVLTYPKEFNHLLDKWILEYVAALPPLEKRIRKSLPVYDSKKFRS